MWIDQSVTKSLAMLYETYVSAFGEDYADVYITELLRNGAEKVSDVDIEMIEQKVNELTSSEEY